MNLRSERGGTVSWNYFRLLGVDPALGRLFAPADEGAGRTPVAILSHDLWIRVFGGEPGVVGRVVQMNGAGYEILGVLPDRYQDPRVLTFGGDVPGIWRTPWIDVSEWPRSGHSWRGIGRLAADVEIHVARAEARDIMTTLGAGTIGPALDDYRDERVAGFRLRGTLMQFFSVVLLSPWPRSGSRVQSGSPSAVDGANTE